MANSTVFTDLPPLPSYTLRKAPDLIPGLNNTALQLLGPVLGYWALSLFFHYIDTYDIWPQYRLHTPAEIAKRNHVTRWECARDVVVQQVIQTIVGALLNYTEPVEYVGKEEYDVAVWATRIRIAQRALPQLLSIVGLNAVAISKNFAGTHPMVAGALAGGKYPSLTTGLDMSTGMKVPAFASWELSLAHAIYWYIFPALQFFVAICALDAWQYFVHRGMHLNKWLYTHIHSRHHRLYVPYAYGALYNHPFEGFFMDTIGTAIAYKVAGMTCLQGAAFFTGSSIKTVDDHCGYALPWDPLQHISSNNAAYHDIHHQSWGIKTNFSQPFFTIWDQWLNTKYKGDVKLRYERDAKVAQFKVDMDKVPVGKEE